MKWLETALTVILVIIVVVVVVILMTGCSSTDAGEPSAKPDTPLENLLIVDTPAPSEMLKIGCAGNVCAYTFSYGGRRCFVVIGQANQMNADSWMMDLECPG